MGFNSGFKGLNKKVCCPPAEEETHGYKPHPQLTEWNIYVIFILVKDSL